MTEVLLTGLKIGKSARWHDGRLWLSNWGAQQILAVGLDGKAEVMTTVPTTIPFSIDWLPDGRLLVVAGPEGRLLRQEPDGSLVDHADLTVLDINLNEIVVDGRGNIFVNGGTNFHPGEGEARGSSPWSPRTAGSSGSPRSSPSPTGWRSPRTTRC
jgi:sugar lactone lactonase YvrE